MIADYWGKESKNFAMESIDSNQELSEIGETSQDDKGHLLSLCFEMSALSQEEGMNNDILRHSCVESRVGRDKQRYEDDHSTGENVGSNRIRLLSGCVPIFRNNHIMMISSSRKKQWILPKGGWERDESLEKAAQRESFEEAGVLGILGSSPLASVVYESKSTKNRLHMFPLYVTSVEERWPEAGRRKRKLIHIDEAINYVKRFRPEYLSILEELKRRRLTEPQKL